jgi:anti-sigma regulatory factor (Ser/Thr protein kinase)
LLPILDLLLAEIPSRWKAEIRLGLQEALVNAAKHGNKLDPSKTIIVRFSSTANQHWWVISDQGAGFKPPHCHDKDTDKHLPCDDWECGRGLYILYQIFDQVQWNADGTELRLSKCVKNSSRVPFLN